MNIFIFWISSSIMSLVMEVINELRVFKYLADYGYLINLQRLSEISNLNPNDDSDKKLFLSLLIPILNFATVFNRTQMINQNLPILINQFCVTDCVDEMTQEEKKEYQKHPTVLKAITLSMKRDIKNMQSASNFKKRFEEELKEKLDDNKSKEEDIICNDKNSLYRQQLSQYKKLLENERDKLIEQKEDEKSDKVLKK